jgi:legumain
MRVQALLAILLFAFISCDQYAVLVAGSNTYSNYRHQSDIFHHYHILVNRGVKPKNIVVMAYDDIANNQRNPFPGQVFNHPDGSDVYAGVVIDYFGKDVTPENFVAVLTGDASAVKKTDERTTGKVLTSTSTDNVYIYFSDHGSDNLIAFPSKYLYADELNDALNTMYQKKMYKELVFYLESCHSGSMFENLLPTNINIYTTTAANPHESSYAEYCSSEAKVNGTSIGSCLGDEYSCRFMEDIDARPGEQLKSWTMQQQFEYLVDAVKGSHVKQYGDLTIAQKSIYEFVSQTSSKFIEWLRKSFRRLSPVKESDPMKNKINNENYRLEWYRMQAESSNNLSAEEEYYDEIMAEGRVTKIFDLFNKKFNLPKRDYNDKVDFDCYREVVKGYEDKCGTLIDRDFKFMTHIANFCTKGINPKKAVRTFKTLCE